MVQGPSVYLSSLTEKHNYIPIVLFRRVEINTYHTTYVSDIYIFICYISACASLLVPFCNLGHIIKYEKKMTVVYFVSSIYIKIDQELALHFLLIENYTHAPPEI